MKGSVLWFVFLVQWQGWRLCNGNDDDIFHGMIDIPSAGEAESHEALQSEEEEREAPFDPTTRNTFQIFKDSLPRNLLTTPLQAQETLLDLVDLYLQEKRKILPYELFYERQDRVSTHVSLVTDVNIAVLFVGFPASSISRMKELWFEKLRRSDHLQNLLSSTFEEILHSPSQLQVQHQFHAIETSIHLDSAIASFLNAIALKKSSTSPHFYINAWEVDDLLTSLKDTLFDSTVGNDEEKEIKPDLTFYILNLDLLQGKNTSAILPHHTYRNGFAYEDMTRMKQSDSIRHAAGQVVRMIPHKSRVIVDGSESKLSLNQGEIPTGPSGNRKKIQTDKIRESKKWATILKENVEKMKEVTFEERILSILSNVKQSPVYESYRHILAREILSNDMQTSFDDSNSQYFQRLHGVDSCETDLWTGTSGVIWLDVRAAEVPPMSLTGAPYSSHSHQPLDYHDLLRKSSTTSHTGTEYRPEDSLHEYTSLIHSIQHHHTHCIELITHLSPTCPFVSTLDDLATMATPDIRLVHFQQIANQIHTLISQSSTEESLEYCGLLLIQRTFLDAVIEISSNLHSLLQREIQSDHNKEDQVYYNDAMNFHNRILGEVLEASSMFIGKGHFSQSGFSSALLNNAMARLSALTLGLSRQILSRPTLLHQKETWLSSTGRTVDEAKRRLSTISSSSSSSRSALNHLTILHEAASFYDEIMNSTRLVHSPFTHHSVGATFYGEDHSHLQVDDEMSRLGTLLPPLYLPQYLEVDIFVVKMQNTYEPIDDDSGFNMPIFMNEIKKLILKNQQLTISTHHIEGVDEAIISLSLENCRRSRGKRTSQGGFEEVTFLSGECVWGQLQHQEANLDDEIKPPSLFRNKHHVVLFFTPSFLPNNHVPHFQFTPDLTAHSSSLEIAVTFGDTILVVQNQQTAVRQDVKCGEHFVFQNLRNPLGIALRAVGSTILGMFAPVIGNPLLVSEKQRSGMNQIVATCGGSPHFGPLSGTTPLFNQFDLDSAHRGRLLRTLEYAVWMASRNQEDLLFLRDHSLRMEATDPLVTLALEAVQERDWTKAGSLLNTILRRVSEQREKIEHGKAKRILELRLKEEGKKPLPSPFLTVAKTLLYDVLRATGLSAAISFLLFLLFNVILSRWNLASGQARR